ncbi:replication-relaxation family protein [Pedococcus soli]
MNPKRLSPKDKAIIRDVNRFRQITSSQLERLYFRDGSDKTARFKTNRTMARLFRWGQVNRIDRAVGGWNGGSDGFTYLPVTSKARTPDPHTLDITELYVQLASTADELNSTKLQTFEPEAWAQMRVGQIELKPDAYVEMAGGGYTDPYFIEVDRGSEFASQLSRKMRHYTAAYNRWDVDRDGDTFPVVLWIVPDAQRARFIENVVRRQDEPSLFQVTTFDDAVNSIARQGAIPRRR